MIRGIVIGKFYPPHLGHSFLINYAIDHSDELTVLICDSPAYTIPAQVRQRWLQKIHPSATVKIIPDIHDDDNSEAWARHTVAFLGYTPDIVFSSEEYGDPYAQFMGCKHIAVDKARVTVPISATRIRADLLKEWEFLHPVVKGDLARRIVVVGAESTGTTTLAQDIANALRVPWVPEYGRLYSEAFMFTNHVWTDEEFTHIARQQQAMEKHVASQSGGVIVCDTNAFATTLWQERYMGSITKEVQAIADRDIVTLYIVTGDEIPFVQDGTRDGEHIRHDMHQRFIELLAKQAVPVIVVAGSKDERMQQALRGIHDSIKTSTAQ